MNNIPANNCIEIDALQLARLRVSMPEDGWSPAAWEQLHRDLDTFLREWGAEADRLGWSAAELYGLAGHASRRRFDVMGLIPTLEGKRVVAMDADRATIEVVRSGVRQTFIRHRARAAAEAATVKTSRDDGIKPTIRPSVTPIESATVKPPARPSRRYNKPRLPMKA